MEENTEKILKEFVPVDEYKDRPFQIDGYGNFRIIINSARGKIESGWVAYQEIAVINAGTDLFIGVSGYYKGSLPTERVLKVEEVDEDGEPSFYKFKILRLVARDKIMNPKEIEEILINPPFDVEEYGIVVKPASQKDFVKIRITQYGNYNDQDRFLSKEDVIKYIIDTFSVDDFDVYDEDNYLVNR